MLIVKNTSLNRRRINLKSHSVFQGNKCVSRKTLSFCLFCTFLITLVYHYSSRIVVYITTCTGFLTLDYVHVCVQNELYITPVQIELNFTPVHNACTERPVTSPMLQPFLYIAWFFSVMYKRYVQQILPSVQSHMYRTLYIKGCT